MAPRPHNFARERAAPPPSTPKIQHPKRLVRKYRKAKTHSTLFTEKLPQEAIKAASEWKSKTPSANETTMDRKVPVVEKNRNDRSSGDITAVPNPVPDTGLLPLDQPGAVRHTSTASLPIALTEHSALITSLFVPAVSTFVPLPPLVSVIHTKSLSIASTPTFTASASPASSSVFDISGAAAQHPTPQHRLSTAVITLLAVGAACVFLGAFIVIRVCSRPRGRAHPTPSLPILDDQFPSQDNFAMNESPIFGGKERFSPRVGSNGGPWAWTQYPQPAPIIAKPIPAAGYGKVAHWDPVHGYGNSPDVQDLRMHSGSSEKTQNQHFPTDHPYGQDAPPPALANLPYHAPLQQVHSALTRAASRLSTASMSLYPGSPLNGHSASDVGIAVGGGGVPGPPFTADGHHVIKRTKSKAALQRSRSNMANEQDNRDRETTYTRYSQGVYDGADVLSPTVRPHSQSPLIPAVAVAPATSTIGGRSRVKSAYYAPGSYPRMSIAPLSTSISTKATPGNPNPFESQHLPLHKSESRRDRDTQALTSALGLASPNPDSPPPPSPQPTLYPDDSLSMVARRPSKRSQKKPAPKHTGHTHGSQDTSAIQTAISPSMDTSSALGSLMLVDFGATNKSLVTLGSRLGESHSQSHLISSTKLPTVTSKKNLHSRSDDKPPRVPSPPPLPSLTQMGLEHANPDAYADYRSPTYSIYGLYESDRKSSYQTSAG